MDLSPRRRLHSLLLRQRSSDTHLRTLDRIYKFYTRQQGDSAVEGSSSVVAGLSVIQTAPWLPVSVRLVIPVNLV